MLEAIIVELTEEARIALVLKVLGTNLTFKEDRYMDLEGPSMRHPGNVLFIILLRQDVMDLLRKAHVFNGGGCFVVNLVVGRDLGKVSIGMVHGTSLGLDDLDGGGLDREIRLFAFPSSLARRKTVRVGGRHVNDGILFRRRNHSS